MPTQLNKRIASKDKKIKRLIKIKASSKIKIQKIIHNR